jgi:hypothetical protein
LVGSEFVSTPDYSFSGGRFSDDPERAAQIIAYLVRP